MSNPLAVAWHICTAAYVMMALHSAHLHGPMALHMHICTTAYGSAHAHCTRMPALVPCGRHLQATSHGTHALHTLERAQRRGLFRPALHRASPCAAPGGPHDAAMLAAPPPDIAILTTLAVLLGCLACLESSFGSDDLTTARASPDSLSVPARLSPYCTWRPKAQAPRPSARPAPRAAKALRSPNRSVHTGCRRCARCSGSAEEAASMAAKWACTVRPRSRTGRGALLQLRGRFPGLLHEPAGDAAPAGLMLKTAGDAAPGTDGGPLEGRELSLTQSLQHPVQILV